MARVLAAIRVGRALYGLAQRIEPVKAAKVSLRRQAMVQHPDEIGSVGDRFVINRPTAPSKLVTTAPQVTRASM